MLFTGRLTANAEVTTVKGDKKVTNFTVALNQRYKTRAGEKRERTAFVDCAYWTNPGLADYLTKGAVVEVSGWIDAQAYMDRKGANRARLTCNVDTIKLFSSAPKAETEPAEHKATNIPTGGKDEDDLPF